MHSGIDTFYYNLFVRQPASIRSTNISDADFICYPNPTADFLHIELNKAYTELSLNILDINGRLLQIANYKDQQIIKLNLNYLPNGIYLIKLKTENFESVKRFTKGF